MSVGKFKNSFCSLMDSGDLATASACEIWNLRFRRASSLISDLLGS